MRQFKSVRIMPCLNLPVCMLGNLGAWFVSGLGVDGYLPQSGLTLSFNNSIQMKYGGKSGFPVQLSKGQGVRIILFLFLQVLSLRLISCNETSLFVATSLFLLQQQQIYWIWMFLQVKERFPCALFLLSYVHSDFLLLSFSSVS